MKLLAVWILMSAVTYWHVMISNFGKNVFQHNLDVEGCCRETIVVFCVAFAIAWPLWWFLMFPICICIGRKEPMHANHVRRDGEPGSAVMKETRRGTVMEANNAKEMREALEKLRVHFMCDVMLLNDRLTPLFAIINHALAKPPRNCDVGTAEEQEARYLCLKKAHIEKITRRPHVGQSYFPESLWWAQMPYEAEKKGDNNGSK